MLRMSLNTSVVTRFLPYLKRYRKEVAAALFLGAIGGTTSALITYYTGKAIDTMLGKGQVAFTALFTIFGLLAGLIVTTTISQWCVQILGNRVAYQSVAVLRKDTFAHLNNLPLRYYDQTAHGNIMSRFTNDLDYVSEATAAIFTNIFSGMMVVAVSLVSMLRLNGLMTLTVILGTICIFVVNWIVAQTTQNKFASQQKIIGNMTGYVSEIVGNQKIVKAFQYEPQAQQTFEQINETLNTIGQQAQFASSLTNPLSRFVDHMTYIAIGLTGGLLALQAGSSVTVGMISSFIIYASQFAKPFIELSGIMTQLQTALAGLERTFHILDTPTETPDSDKVLSKETVRGDVVFDHVSFSYSPDTPLIQDFNLTVKAGDTVAIVGKTGAGKSTLVNLLMRFYDVDEGEIRIDGIPINTLSRDSLRRCFGMVLQDTWLFAGTVRENLLFGNPHASDEEMTAACKAASIHSFIERLPDGYDTLIGQDGIKISDGQRQLLTIARTMLSQPPMLILDEATSSVDTLTEQHIQDAFLRMMAGKTSFVIAHRLTTIKEADSILVMDHGQVVEVGSHSDLLERTDSYYRRLYQAQFDKDE